MNEILLFILQGYSILVVAILINLVVGIFRIKNWYWFIEALAKLGPLNTLKMMVIQDWIFLFVVYPLVLIWSTKIPSMIFP